MFADDEYFYNSYNPRNSSPFGYSGKFADLDHHLPPLPEAFDEFYSRGGSSSSSASQALVLDNEKGELVKAPATRVAAGKKEVSEAKALAALKSHSEAERRRRERINAHLATLRGLVPGTEKMDKATLLAEVISQVKMLKQNAMESSKGHLIPMDNDEVKVVVEPSLNHGSTTLSFRASLCCEYRPELMSEIRQAIESLQLKLLDAEMSTLGSWVKNVFILTKCGGIEDNAEAQSGLASCIHEALSSVVEKGYASAEYSTRKRFSTRRDG